MEAFGGFEGIVATGENEGVLGVVCVMAWIFVHVVE
jgi:hypothetical protein